LILRRLAKLKYRVLRVNPYVQFFNTALLLALTGWKWWYALAVCGLLVAFWFEKKYGLPGEMDVAWKSSPEWTRFMAEWDEFKGKK